MGLSTAMYNGLSGMTVNSEMISVSGNNIANVNTPAFKTSRVNFETQISRTLRAGSAPTGRVGGTNPSQLGLGTRIGSVNRNFKAGSLQPTGLNTDMAIEGNGWFILDLPEGQRYTRVGKFGLDRDFNLVAPGNGGFVQGWGIDEDFNIREGALEDIQIPIGAMTITQATSSVDITGNLNAGGDSVNVNNQGSVTQSDPFFDALVTPATVLVGTSVGGGTVLAAGDYIKLSDVIKGGELAGQTLPDKTFLIGSAPPQPGYDDAGTTVQDVLDFITEAIGIDLTADGAPVLPGSPPRGVSLDAAGQSLVIHGNVGTLNSIELADGSLAVYDSTDTLRTSASNWTDDATFSQPDGESARTTFVVYDSLGNDLTVDMTFVKISADNTGTQWRYYVQSDHDTDLDRVLGSGDIAFDTKGRLITTTAQTFTVDRDLTGSATPQNITINFNSIEGGLSSLVDVDSLVSNRSQDGFPIGTLVDFAVADNGVISGIFSNSIMRNLGQIGVALFANEHGLIEEGGNNFNTTINSGAASVVKPTTGGSGSIIGQTLEISNVELSNEFINLITASTGFSAASRVLTTSDQMIQELLNAVR